MGIKNQSVCSHSFPTAGGQHEGGSNGQWQGDGAAHPEPSKRCGCTLDGCKILDFVKCRKSVILGVWAAPGAPGTRAKGGVRSPPPFGRASGAPGAAQTPKMADFRSVKIENHLPKYSHTTK